jgi:hypothetical protein
MADDRKDDLREEASAPGLGDDGRARQAASDVARNSSAETGAATAAARSGQVSGLFKDRESAETAYRSLVERGYGTDDVDVLMSDETRKRYFEDAHKTDLGDKALEGAGIGSAIGGTTGAVLAAVAAIGTNIFVPGLGLWVSGPLVAALAGGGAGSLTGGLIGALVGAGIPEEHAKVYDEGIRRGDIYMGVNPRNEEDAQHFEREWKTRSEHVYR